MADKRISFCTLSLFYCDRRGLVMWSRTFAGLIVGLLLSISIVLNLNLLLPLKEDTMLLIGVLIAFPLWAGIQVWSYSFVSAKKAWLKLSLVLVPSVLINAVLLAVR
jgi:hypothetical protein